MSSTSSKIVVLNRLVKKSASSASFQARLKPHRLDLVFALASVQLTPCPEGLLAFWWLLGVSHPFEDLVSVKLWEVELDESCDTDIICSPSPILIPIDSVFVTVVFKVNVCILRVLARSPHRSLDSKLYGLV